MKKICFVLFTLAFACNNKNPAIDGAYILVAAQYGDSILTNESIKNQKTIKVFKDGYWINTTFFGRKQTAVETASGGTYSFKNGSYFETMNFSTEGEPEFEKTYEFNYKTDGNRLIQEGTISNDKGKTCLLKAHYDKIPSDKTLADTSLEGVWQIRESEWFGKKTVDPDLMHFKIYSNPRFAWASYHHQGKDFIGVGGGTYEFDGSKLIEHMEYFSYYTITPADEKIDVIRLSSKAIQLINLGSAGKEIYDKVQRDTGKK